MDTTQNNSIERSQILELNFNNDTATSEGNKSTKLTGGRKNIQNLEFASSSSTKHISQKDNSSKKRTETAPNQHK